MAVRFLEIGAHDLLTTFSIKMEHFYLQSSVSLSAKVNIKTNSFIKKEKKNECILLYAVFVTDREFLFQNMKKQNS